MADKDTLNEARKDLAAEEVIYMLLPERTAYFSRKINLGRVPKYYGRKVPPGEDIKKTKAGLKNRGAAKPYPCPFKL